MTADERLFFSVREVAQIGRWSENFVYQRVQAEDIPSVRVGRSIRIPAYWVRQAINGEPAPSQQPAAVQ